MSHILYRCPRTDMNVQAWLTDDAPAAAAPEHEVVHCPACMHMHFIDRATRRLVGHDPE